MASCSGTAITSNVSPASRSGVAQDRRYPRSEEKTTHGGRRRWVAGARRGSLGIPVNVFPTRLTPGAPPDPFVAPKSSSPIGSPTESGVGSRWQITPYAVGDGMLQRSPMPTRSAPRNRGARPSVAPTTPATRRAPTGMPAHHPGRRSDASLRPSLRTDHGAGCVVAVMRRMTRNTGHTWRDPECPTIPYHRRSRSCLTSSMTSLRATETFCGKP